MSANFLNAIDELKQKSYLQIFTIYLRYLIGGAFVIAAFGMGKVSGSANLIHSLDKPIGELEPLQQFFRVMTESGLYWKFIGWTQIAAGALLITQRFAKLGAMIFFGLILNIFIITIAYHFQGTPVITGLMLLANLYLLLWDTRSFLFLIKDSYTITAIPLKIIDRSFWAWIGIIMIISVVVIMISHLNIFYALGIPFAEGLLGFVIFFWRFNRPL